jgi:hypothetical protein
VIKDKVRAMCMNGQVQVEAFEYTSDLLPLVGSSTTPVLVNIQNDSDFLILATIGKVYTGAGAVQADPDLMLTFLDTGTGRQLMSGPLHFGNCVGSAQLPYIWPEPKLMRGGATLQVTMTNNVAANRYVYLSFHGYKVFYLTDVRL